MKHVFILITDSDLYIFLAGMELLKHLHNFSIRFFFLFSEISSISSPFLYSDSVLSAIENTFFAFSVSFAPHL